MNPTIKNHPHVCSTNHMGAFSLFFSPFSVVVVVVVFVFARSAFADECVSSCSASDDDFRVRFPFWLTNRQPPRCGAPGFSLSCDPLGQTIIDLSSSGQFVVNKINYSYQAIYLTPQFCLANSVRSFDLRFTPFADTYQQKFTFFNCSGQFFGFVYPGVVVTCLGGENYTVIAMRTTNDTGRYKPPACRELSTISVPVRQDSDLNVELELTWGIPSCRVCESSGGTCGLRDDGTIGCSRRPSHGLSKGEKYGIIFGVGIPAIVCILGLMFYTASKLWDYSQRYRRRNYDLASIAIMPQPSSSSTSTGLDRPTIDSYPKIVLGDSFRLPNPNDTTCPICLSEYMPQDTLRSIPECNHYFHAVCIDEWLRLNATCPVCRNSPDSSSLVTPCSSASSSSLSTTST